MNSFIHLMCFYVNVHVCVCACPKVCVEDCLWTLLQGSDSSSYVGKCFYQLSHLLAHYDVSHLILRNWTCL